MDFRIVLDSAKLLSNTTDKTMIQDYQNMTLSHLVEQLAEKTQLYMRLRNERPFGREFDECKAAIRQIQAAIETRKVINIDRSDPGLRKSDRAS